MASTPFHDDPLPSYLENTKSTAYRWQQDVTDSTAHPSVGDNTTREHDLPKDEEAVRLDRVKQLASFLDDLDASAKSSRVRTTELLQTHSRSRSSSPPDSPSQRDQSHTQGQQSSILSQPPPRGQSRRELSAIHEHSEDEDDLLSDLDEMINNVPSDEEPDPIMSPGPAQSTPYNKDTEKSKSRNIARDLFNRGDVSPVLGLKSAQKTPATTKTPGKTVDFKDPDVLPRYPAKPPRTPGYVAPSPIERKPSSPRKFSGQNAPIQPPADPISPTPVTDPALQQLAAQLKQMQEEIRKRDDLIQNLSKQFQPPAQQNANIMQELADAKRQIEQLKESTSQLRRGQEDLLAMTTPEKGVHGLGSTTTHRVRERAGKWHEYLETPLSVSQRRSRRDTPRHSRLVDEEEILPPKVPKAGPTGPIPPVQSEKPGDDEEIARLKDALAKAESQISQLRLERAIGKGPGDGHELHARPLGPNMMPDAKNSRLAREEKMYYRLGLYKIDRLCSNETANLLKNVLIQLDTPFDQLAHEITNLSRKMNKYNRLQEFAMGVHEKLYNGEKMELNEGEGIDIECLREMLTRVGKLVSRRR